MWRRLFLTILLLQHFLGCGGKASSSTGIEGYYSIERTCVTTAPVARTAPSPGVLQRSGKGNTTSITLASIGSPGKIRVTTGSGCSFIANVSGPGIVTAVNMECDVLPHDSALWSDGIEARQLLLFSFNPKEGVSREHAMVSLRWPDPMQPDVPLKGYNVCEGHVPNQPSPKDVFLVKYDGDAKDSVRQPDAIQQAAAPGCTDLVGEGATSGALFVRYGQDKNELIVYEEGVGCTAHAKSSDGIIYRADGTDCEFGDFGVNLLGVKARHLKSYTIDLGSKTWSYSSMDDTSVMDIPQCLQATSQLSGDLPQ